MKKDKEERSRKSMYAISVFQLQSLIYAIAYRGRQAATLFLQAYQLILWKQTHALVHDHGFPEQFEVSLTQICCFAIPQTCKGQSESDISC